MNNLLTWLAKKPSRKDYIVLPILFFVFDTLNSLICSTLFVYLGLITEEHEPLGITILSLEFPIVLLIIVLVEELIFRIIPLTISFKILGPSMLPSLFVLLISSVVFGLIHGSPYFILMQGVGGICYGLLFIKFSNNGKRILIPSCLVIGMHFAFDILIGLLILATGETIF